MTDEDMFFCGIVKSSESHHLVGLFTKLLDCRSQRAAWCSESGSTGEVTGSQDLTVPGSRPRMK